MMLGLLRLGKLHQELNLFGSNSMKWSKKIEEEYRDWG